MHHTHSSTVRTLVSPDRNYLHPFILTSDMFNLCIVFLIFYMLLSHSCRISYYWSALRIISDQFGLLPYSTIYKFNRPSAADIFKPNWTSPNLFKCSNHVNLSWAIFTNVLNYFNINLGFIFFYFFTLQVFFIFNGIQTKYKVEI